MDEAALLKSDSSDVENSTKRGVKYDSIPETSSDSEIETQIEEKKINNLQSLMNLLKGNIGTGILVIPAAFKAGGLWVGIVGVFIIGILATYCMHLLVACSRHVVRKINKKDLDYGKLAEEVFLIGPQGLHPHSKKAKITIYVFLSLTQFGFCVAYIVFISKNLEMVVEQYFTVHWVSQIYQCFVMIILIPYLAITNLRILSFFSGIANICIIFGLSVILYNCFVGLPPVTSRPAFGSWPTLPLYISICVFTFEGIGVILPLENRIKWPRDFTGWFGVINLGMTITTCLIAAVGFFGYLKFGDEIADSITENLPKTIFYNVVRLLFVLAIYFTYGIQFYVPIEFLWSSIQSRLEPGRMMYKYGEYLLRLIFLIITFVLAALVPHLDLVIAIVGALASTAVAIIIPCLLDTLCLYEGGYGRFRWKLVRNVIILVIGIFCLIVGTATTLYNIVKTFQSS